MMRYAIDLSCFDDDRPTFESSPPEPIKIMCYCQPAKPGPPGPPGRRGRTGRTGRIGTRGEKGDRGDKGDKGRTGDKGDEGKRGPKGDPGRDIKGEPGEKGPIGEKGDPGPPPTQEQVLEALIQVIGDRGLITVKGDPGEPGLNGRDGLDGHNGRDGRDGQNGWSPSIDEIKDLIQQCMPQPSYSVSEIITTPVMEWSQYLIKITNARNIMADAFVMLSASSLNVAGYVPMYEGKYSMSTIAICSTNHKRSFCVRVSSVIKPTKMILVSSGYETCVMPRQVCVENSDIITLDFEDIATYEQHIENGSQLFLTMVW